MSNTILITGASSGFGRDMSETLAQLGYRVFASMRNAQGKNRATADALEKQGIEVVELDVSSDISVEQGVMAVLEQTGSIDVLINNAGVASAGVTEAFTANQAEMIFNTNVLGILRTTRAVLPTMRQNHDGLIINIGSILGRVTFPFFGIYGASKMALEALTDSLRYEVSQFGVDVILVQPSAYPTNMYTSIQTPGDSDRIASYGEVGQIPDSMFQTFMSMFESADAPKPHDIAEAVARLIAQPKGDRPVRTVVGTPFGSDQVNKDTAPVQSSVIEGLNLGHLTKVLA